MNRMIPEFYFTDRRLGDVVFINGKDAYREYNADLISDTETPGNITNEVQYKPGHSRYFIHNQDIEPAVHEFAFYVGGKTRADALHNVSALLAACRNCEIAREDDPWKYVGVLQSYTKEETGVEYFFRVNVVEAVLKVRETVSMTFTNNDPPGKYIDFENPGTTEAALYIQYRNSDTDRTVDIYNSTLTGNSIIFSGTGLITFDPNEATVTRSGSSNITVSEFITFIKLAPGKNRIYITMSDTTSASYTLELACTPVYL